MDLFEAMNSLMWFCLFLKYHHSMDHVNCFNLYADDPDKKGGQVVSDGAGLRDLPFPPSQLKTRGDDSAEAKKGREQSVPKERESAPSEDISGERGSGGNASKPNPTEEAAASVGVAALHETQLVDPRQVAENSFSSSLSSQQSPPLSPSERPAPALHPTPLVEPQDRRTLSPLETQRTSLKPRLSAQGCAQLAGCRHGRREEGAAPSSSGKAEEMARGDDEAGASEDVSPARRVGEVSVREAEEARRDAKLGASAAAPSTWDRKEERWVASGGSAVYSRANEPDGQRRARPGLALRDEGVREFDEEQHEADAEQTVQVEARENNAPEE